MGRRITIQLDNGTLYLFTGDGVKEWGKRPAPPTVNDTTYGLMPSGETVSLQVEQPPTK